MTNKPSSLLFSHGRLVSPSSMHLWPKHERFSFYDHELWPITTSKPDLDGVKINQHAKCLGQSHLVQKLLSRHTQSDKSSTWTTKQ